MRAKKQQNGREDKGKSVTTSEGPGPGRTTGQYRGEAIRTITPKGQFFRKRKGVSSTPCRLVLLRSNRRGFETSQRSKEAKRMSGQNVREEEERRRSPGQRPPSSWSMFGIGAEPGERERAADLEGRYKLRRIGYRSSRPSPGKKLSFIYRG